MTIYKCDGCGAMTKDDILPSTWCVIQVVAAHGTELPASMKARHLCDKHNLEEMLHVGSAGETEGSATGATEASGDSA
jgi:hypothetical protein